MKEKIEKKIKECIDSILRKEHIDYEEYQTLAAEFGRLEAKEKAEKWEAETEERNKRMAELVTLPFTTKF
jgi:hypothetical protein